MQWKPSHILWDWNGTLLDDVQPCVRSINRMLERRHLRVLRTEEYREVFRFPVRSYYAALGFDFAKDDWDGLAREFHDHYDREASQATLREGIADTLRDLRDREIPMSVLSASEQNILDRMLLARGIRHYFESTRGLSDLHASSKLGLGQQLLSDLRLPPGEVLLIGDTMHDFEVASGLKCRCVLLAGGHQSEHRIARCGCPVLRQPSDLRSYLLGAGEGTAAAAG